MIRTHHFAELTSSQVAALAEEEEPVVLLLPMGATEPHGPHAPLATDTIISAAVCERVAARLAGDPHLRVLVLPGMPYGVTRYAAAFPGVVGVGEQTLRSLVADVCESLAGQGWRRVVVVNNHFEPEHVAVLREVTATLRGKGAAVALFDVLRRNHVARLPEEFRAGRGHAGRYETSLVLAARPDLVDRESMTGLPEVPVDMAEAIAAGRTDFVSMGMTDGYCGAPAQATSDEGDTTLATLADMLVELVREVAGWGFGELPR